MVYIKTHYLPKPTYQVLRKRLPAVTCLGTLIFKPEYDLTAKKSKKGNETGCFTRFLKHCIQNYSLHSQFNRV